jgi:cell division protein ZapA
MAEVSLTINGRTYGISCEDGQQKRVQELGRYVDSKLREISKAGAASTESHLLVLTALMMADEIIDLRDNMAVLGGQVEETGAFQQEEAIIIRAIGSLADRIDLIADRLQKA